MVIEFCCLVIYLISDIRIPGNHSRIARILILESGMTVSHIYCRHKEFRGVVYSNNTTISHYVCNITLCV